jgi:hypothetical protein
MFVYYELSHLLCSLYFKDARLGRAHRLQQQCDRVCRSKILRSATRINGDINEQIVSSRSWVSAYHA